MLTDQDILLFAFTREEQDSYVLPYDSKRFPELAKQASGYLADPNSDIPALHGVLDEISAVMVQPVTELLNTKTQVVVLTDGMLNIVPFDLLTLKPVTVFAPKEKPKKSFFGSFSRKKKVPPPKSEIVDYRPMILTHTVQVAPSLRYMVHTGKEKSTRAVAGLFALADPVYSSSGNVGHLRANEVVAVTRGNQYLSYFTRLPETRTEVEGIAAMFADDPVKTLYGVQARESKVKSADLTGYRYLHFATHGILGSDVPGLTEPALVTATEPDEDGFLTASEAQAMELNADLAVLSACNTGSGKYLTGEGVMGMSRAFLLAGSKSVLVSLWSVPSKETEQLMLAFYKYLKAGEPIAAAIRRAKFELMMLGDVQTGRSENANRGIGLQERSFSAAERNHPFFWSAFIPLGI